MKSNLSPAARRAKLIRDLAVIPENIRNEAIRQPLLFVEAVRYRVAKMRHRARAESALKAWSGQQWLLIKKRADANASKVTNDLVKAMIERDPEYQRLSLAVNEAEAREEFSKLLLEAYRMRRDGVRILADAEGYEASKAVADATADSMNRKLSSEARKIYRHRGIVRERD